MYHPCVTSGPHTFPHGLFTFVSDRVLFITPCTASYYRGEGVVSSFTVFAIKTKYMQYSKRTRLNIRVGVEMCVCVCVCGGAGGFGVGTCITVLNDYHIRSRTNKRRIKRGTSHNCEIFGPLKCMANWAERKSKSM